MEVVNFRMHETILQGRYNKDDYRSSTIGNSDCNQYIPFYSIFFHEFISFKESEVRILEYSLPVSSNTTFRRYSELFGHLVTTTRPVCFTFSSTGTPYRLNIHRGLIYDDEGKILLCLGIDTNYVLNTPVETLKTNLDKTKLVLFVSNELGNPIYKNLRKKLDTEFFNSCREQDIDIVNTNNINKWVFKNNYEIPKFKSIKEMNSYLKDTLPKNLLLK